MKRDSLYGTLSGITYQMLIDEFAGYDILQEPPNKRRRFKWVTSRHGLSDESLYTIDETLFVCSDKSFEQLIGEQPDAFMVVAVEKGIPSWLEENPENAIVVRCPRHEALLQKLQMRFIQQKEASHELEVAIIADEPVEDILGVARKVIGAPLAVISAMTPMRPQKTSDLQSFMLKHLSASGLGKTEGTVDLGTFNFMGSVYHAIAQSAEAPDGDYDLITAAYRGKAPTPGQLEAFDLFAKRVKARLTSREGGNDLGVENASTLLKRLINGSYVSRIQIDAFESREGIGPEALFRLLGADLADTRESDRGRVRYLVERSFPSFVCGVQSGDRYIALLRSRAIDGTLANDTLSGIIEEKIAPAHDIRFAATQAYDNLQDTHFARQQIELIFGYASFVDTAAQFVAADPSTRRYYSFEDCYPYALMDLDNMDPAFKDFCSSHTLVDKLYAEDEENGTENARILLMYQFYGRRASVVAGKLHMHRNTVLYHIDKIQKRFNIDLEDPSIQERLMLDSKALFKRLAYKPEALDELLSPVKRLR